MTRNERIEYHRAAARALAAVAIAFHIIVFAFIFFGATGTAGPLPGIAWALTVAAFYQGVMYFVTKTC